MEFKVPATGAEWRSAPRVCRCCLSEGCYKDISTEYYWMGEKETYAEMLKECFDLTISLQDAANSNGRLICEVCITRLRDATNFKKQVVRSEQRFAEHLQSGASLSTISVTEGGPYQEVKVEGVKDEMLVSDDDDVDDGPVDDDTLDPDYDESDSLPLKYEVQKKEALVELSFGDEIPTLSNTETTIRRVSAKGKDKSPAKKLKLNKKELTIKPVKASGSKVKAAKAPKAPKVPKAPKPAKPATKKGHGTDTGDVTSMNAIDEPPRYSIKMIKFKLKKVEKIKLNSNADEAAMMLANAAVIIECSNACPFRWWRNKFSCAYCDGKFVDGELLKRHTMEAHSRNRLDFMEGLRRYEPVKLDVAELRCELCAEPMAGLDALKEHLTAAHGKPLDPECGDGVIPFVLDKDDIRCRICLKEFHVFSKLNQHMNAHYQNYICETCGKGFATPNRLYSHAQAHQRGEFPCRRCDATFATMAARNTHVSTAHRPAHRYRCPRCAATFRAYNDRMRHLTRAHGERAIRYRCESCPLAFASCYARTKHVKYAHLQLKRQQCELCPSRFVTPCELRNHMVKHGGERKYQCDVCKKAYARMKTLREHMRIHNNDRRFVCAVCSQAFVQNCSLKQHVKVHHPDVLQA